MLEALTDKLAIAGVLEAMDLHKSVAILGEMEDKVATKVLVLLKAAPLARILAQVNVPRMFPLRSPYVPRTLPECYPNVPRMLPAERSPPNVPPRMLPKRSPNVPRTFPECSTNVP